MMELLFFLFGLIIGGLTGITAICLIQNNTIMNNKLLNLKNEKKNN